MKKVLTTVLSAAVLVLAAAPAAIAAGHTAQQMEDAGYDCFDHGGWIHCWDLDKVQAGASSIPVKVFNGDGSEFLGTELLLRADRYNGQQCAQDGGEAWAALQLGDVTYYACHHFDTTA